MNMRDEKWIEEMLEQAPGRALGVDAEARIERAIRKAERPRATPMWQRRVALWQAIAAVLVLGAIGVWVGRATSPARTDVVGAREDARRAVEIMVELEHSLTPERRESMQTQKWSAMGVH